jgi:hypothetical protein
VGRTTDRANLPEGVRLQLAEKDLDEHDEEMAEIKAQNAKVLWALVGILISTATASILLALNLAVGP